MTIAPFSVFGNIQGANAQAGGSILAGGLSGLFAALLGNESEGLEGLASLGADGSGESSDLLSFLENIDLQKQGSLGETLKMFLPQAGEGTDVSEFLDGIMPQTTGLDVAHDELAGLMQSKEAHTEVFYQKIVIEIQKVAVSVQTAGIDLSGIDSLDALASAFKELGMSPEMAQAKAERIDEAIKMMKQRLGIETKEPLEERSLTTALYNMVTGSDFSGVKMLASSTQIEVSQTLMAFESTSALVSSDLGMKVLKGESLSPSLQGKIGEALLGDKAGTVQNTIKTADFAADTPKGQINGLPEGEFEPLNPKDIPVKAENGPLGKGEMIQPALKNATMSRPAEVAALSDEAGSFLAANEEVTTENKKRVSAISADKVLKEGKTQDLFTVKPQTSQGQNVGMQLETAEGEVVDLDGLDESADDIMEVVARKTSFEGRVEGLSRQAMVKISTVSTQVEVQMRQLANQGGGQIKFRLDPPELGEIDIQLKVTGGNVKGTIIVQSVEAAEQLARDLRLLQESLQDAGLDLNEDGLQFKLRDDQPDSEHRHAEQDSEQDGEGGIEPETITADTQQDNKGWVKPDAILDVSV